MLVTLRHSLRHSYSRIPFNCRTPEGTLFLHLALGAPQVSIAICAHFSDDGGKWSPVDAWAPSQTLWFNWSVCYIGIFKIPRMILFCSLIWEPLCSRLFSAPGYEPAVNVLLAGVAWDGVATCAFVIWAAKPVSLKFLRPVEKSLLNKT
jgi:hypothetical protein